MRYESFDKVISSLRKKKRRINLLLGNGFSMAYDPQIFSYNALYDFIEKLDDDVMAKILSATKTKNFELMMAQLETFLALLKAFGADQALQASIEQAHKKLRQSLLDSIK